MLIHKSGYEIFKIKGRPVKNPLIIHYHNIDNLKDDDYNENFIKLYKKFCQDNYYFKKLKIQNMF